VHPPEPASTSEAEPGAATTEEDPGPA
jgi:hypothetical protein